MKKFFDRGRQKKAGLVLPDSEEQLIPNQHHHQSSVYLQSQNSAPVQPLQSPTPRSVHATLTEGDHWEAISLQDDSQLRVLHPPPSALSRKSSFSSLPPGASPPITSPNGLRSPSPYAPVSSPSSNNKFGSQTRDSQSNPVLRKKPANSPAAVGILRALDPPRTELGHMSSESMSTIYPEVPPKDREKEFTEKKDKWSFWNRSRDAEKEKDKQRFHDRDKDRREKDRFGQSQNELTKMIGFLTATASEDWSLVLEVCERASASEPNAKEAVRALRREFKYGKPPAQLSAARLWAIMLRNSSELFVTQSTSRKFLDSLEDLLSSPETSPVVRERVLDVVGAAAFASGSKKDAGFRGLWRRVKPADKPDEGVPLDNDDDILNPPLSGRLTSQYNEGAFNISSGVADRTPLTTPLTSAKKSSSPNRNRIIPRDEDIRRLFQECKLGQGNAALLSQALALSKPEDLKKKDVVKEFYVKCRASQELIFAQIPWAYSGAEKSRAEKALDLLENNGEEKSPVQQTIEEKLLDALLAANGELVDALSQYDDIERIASERQVEDRSRKETRMDWKHFQNTESESTHTRASDPLSTCGSSSSNPSRSNSPPSAVYVSHPYETNTLAPPPPAPHGPRLPSQAPTSYAYSHSRTPSPATLQHDSYERVDEGVDLHSDMSHLRVHHGIPNKQSDDPFGEINGRPAQPSAKALGKRKEVEEPLADQTSREDDMYSEGRNALPPDARTEGEDSDVEEGWGQHNHHQQTQYVYDAVAERTLQRIKEGQALQAQGKPPLVNGVVR